MRSNELNKKIKRAPQVIYRDVEGVVYILDPKTGTIHTLNETASFLWRRLSKPTAIGKLVDAVCLEFDINRKVAQKDVFEFISGYIKRGFLR